MNGDVDDVKMGPFTVLSVVGVGMVSDSVPKLPPFPNEFV